MSRRRTLDIPPNAQPTRPPTLPDDLPLVGAGETPASICTVAYGNSEAEACTMVATARIIFPDTPILILCDPDFFEKFRLTGLSTRGLKFVQVMTPEALDRKHEKLGLQRFDKKGSLWNPAVLSYKMDAIHQALQLFGATLFVDSDVLFLKPFTLPRREMVALSPHYSGMTEWESSVGAYNAGYIYVSGVRDFAHWWRQAFSKTSKFFEQEGLQRIPPRFSPHRFGPEHNVGFWSQPNRWGDPVSMHVHLQNSRRDENKASVAFTAHDLAKRAKDRLAKLGLTTLIRQLNDGSLKDVHIIWPNAPQT